MKTIKNILSYPFSYLSSGSMISRSTEKNTYIVVNEKDPNQMIEVTASDKHQAATAALKKLGWWVAR